MKIIYILFSIVIASASFSFTNFEEHTSHSEDLFFFPVIYIFFDNIDGGSLISGRTNWSDVTEMSGGFQHTSQGPRFKNISVTVKRDIATPVHYSKSLEGGESKTVIIEEMSGPEEMAYKSQIITMQDVKISYIDIGSSATVRLDLSPKKYHVTYNYRDGTGALIPYSFGWDYENGEVWDGM